MINTDILRVFKIIKSTSDKVALYRKGDTCFIGFVVEENNELVLELSKDPIESYIEHGYELVSESSLTELVHQASIDTYVTGWKEISEERFNDMLEILPPEKWEHNIFGSMFRMCEYITMDITTHFAEYNRKFYEANLRATNSYSDYLKELTEFVNLQTPES